MELSVILTSKQAERLIDDPEAELVLHFSDGTKVFVRITDDYTDLTGSPMGDNETLH